MKPIEVIIPVPSERVQFSKELYDQNPSGWKVEDREGKPVRVLATDVEGVQPIVSVSGSGTLMRHHADGCYTMIPTPTQHDLFMRPVESGDTQDMYVNVYDKTIGFASDSITEADEASSPGRIALLHIKFVAE